MMDESEIIPPETKGRPKEFADEIFEEVCDRMANGQGLRKICEDPEMPSRQTFLRWIEKDTGRQNQYQAAREALMDWYAEEILEIAWDDSKDTIKDKAGEPKQNHEWINRSRLKVDTLKFLMAKLHPKRYGDKVPEQVAFLSHEAALNELDDPKGLSIGWKDTVRVIVHPMLREDGSLIPQGTPEHDAAVERAAQEARAKGAKSVRVGYDIRDGADASVADLMREVDGRTRTVDQERNDRNDRKPAGPPPLITYQPVPPPADLSPEAWARITRVSELIEQIAPSDVMPEAVFGIIEAALRRHYLAQAAE